MGHNRHLSYGERRDIESAAAKSSQLSSTAAFQQNPKLVKFQNLIGIQSFRTLLEGRPAPNPGIYKRTVDEESRAHFGYTLSAYIVNSFFLLQIILGAALTALGAAHGPPAAITVLGAANTIIAGILNYLKGQGLPARLEQSLHLLRTLREHIEEREREFTEPDCGLDVDEVVQSLVQMYKEVRQSAEDNAPGNVMAPKGAIVSLLKKTESGNRVPAAESTVVGGLGDRLREAQSAMNEATPAMKHGLEDVKAIRFKADQEMEAQQQALNKMVAGVGGVEERISQDQGEARHKSE